MENFRDVFKKDNFFTINTDQYINHSIPIFANMIIDCVGKEIPEDKIIKMIVSKYKNIDDNEVIKKYHECVNIFMKLRDFDIRHAFTNNKENILNMSNTILKDFPNLFIDFPIKEMNNENYTRIKNLSEGFFIRLTRIEDSLGGFHVEVQPIDQLFETNEQLNKSFFLSYDIPFLYGKTITRIKRSDYKKFLRFECEYGNVDIGIMCHYSTNYNIKELIFNSLNKKIFPFTLKEIKINMKKELSTWNESKRKVTIKYEIISMNDDRITIPIEINNSFEEEPKAFLSFPFQNVDKTKYPEYEIRSASKDINWE